MEQPYLSQHQTPRLNIRPLTLADATAWEDFFTDNENLRFFVLNPKSLPAEKAKLWLEWQLKRYRENRYGLLALESKETGELVGMAGLLTQELDGLPELEIGYHLLPQYWGNGYATEAARFFKAFVRQNNLADSVVSIIHVENLRSQNVAVRNGMERGPKTEFQGKPVYIYRTPLQ